MKITLFLFILLPIFGYTQDVKTFNLYVMLNYDNIIVDSLEVPDTTINVDMGFMIDTLSNADSVFINVGTTDGGSETIASAYEVIYSSGRYYLYDGIDSTQFYGRNTYLTCVVDSEDIDQYIYFEVYAKDQNGVLSEKSKFKL